MLRQLYPDAFVARLSRRTSSRSTSLGCLTSTVGRWVVGWPGASRPSTEAGRRLLDVLVVLEQLPDLLAPQSAHAWLSSPNLLLDHEKPIALLADGHGRRVLGLIDALGDAVFF